MQSVVYASSCFAAMRMNVRSKLIPALAATSVFALTAYLRLDATCVLFDGVKDARNRAYAAGVNLLQRVLDGLLRVRCKKSCTDKAECIDCAAITIAVVA